MLIKEILDHLTSNELSQHKYGGYSNGAMEDIYIPKVVTTLNQGIRDINTHIDICKDSMVVQLDERITDYRMNKLYAKANTASTVAEGKRFILDANSRRFDYDFRKFKSIAPFNNEANQVYELNHRTAHNSISIISYDTFRVAIPITGVEVSVEYSHAPRGIKASTMLEASIEEFTLPTDILTALYAYVESKMTAGMGTQNDMADDNKAISLYMAELQKLKHTSLIADDMYINNSFKLGGWV